MPLCYIDPVLSADFIPRALAPVAHVDAVEQEGERGGVEAQFAIFDIGRLGPTEGPAFQSFRQNPNSSPIPVEDLEEAAAFVSEGEDGAAFGIFQQSGAHRVVQAVEAAAHVAGLDSHEDFQTAGKTQHDLACSSSRISATASATWLAEAIESLAPPGRRISMVPSAAGFPHPSITAGIREKNPE